MAVALAVSPEWRVRVQLAHTSHSSHLIQGILKSNSRKYMIKSYVNWIYEICHFMCVWVFAHVTFLILNWSDWHMSFLILNWTDWHMSHFSWWPNKKACSPSQIISLQLSTIGTMAEAQLHASQYPSIFCSKEVRPHQEQGAQRCVQRKWHEVTLFFSTQVQVLNLAQYGGILPKFFENEWIRR